MPILGPDRYECPNCGSLDEFYTKTHTNYLYNERLGEYEPASGEERVFCPKCDTMLDAQGWQ